MFLENTLNELIARMKSDYIPEHLQAANEYIYLGGCASELLCLIQTSDAPNENLISMFLYISSQEGDIATQIAWDYLLSEFKKYPHEFESINCDPHDLKSNRKYLLFAARKYLIIPKRIQCFLDYAIKSQNDAISIRKNLLQGLNINNDSSDEILGHNEECINNIRFALETEYKLPINEKKENLSNYEIGLFSKINEWYMYNYCCKILGEKEGTLLYHLWICNFFLPTALEVKWTEESNEDLSIYLQITGNTQKRIDAYNYMYYSLNPTAKKSDDSTPFSVEDMFLPRPKSKYEIINKMNGDPLAIPFRFSCIVDIATNCTDNEFVLNIIKQVEDVLEAYTQNEINKEEKLLDLMELIFFKQSIYDITYGFGLDFSNNCACHTTKSLEYLQERFGHYLKKEFLFQLGTKQEKQAYLVLDLLSAKASPFAYKLVRELITTGEYKKLDPPVSNYFIFSLQQFYRGFNCKKAISKAKANIGYYWEKICQTICTRQYQNVMTNHNIILSNNTIPDIAWGEIVMQNGIVYHTSVIAECKKSMYYAQYSSINNSTTRKYIDYCDEFQYWILEKPNDFKYPNYKKIKFIFGQDLLEYSWVSDNEKEQIKKLFELNELCQRFSLKTANQLDLIKIIDFFQEHPYFVYDKCYERKKTIFVIRQYDKNGQYINEYKDKQEASKTTGISENSIMRSIRNEHISAGDFIWRKAVLNSPQNNIEPLQPTKNLLGKKIAQIDSNGEIINIFDALNIAAKDTLINQKSIRDTINGRQKHAGGYFWKVLD